MTAIRSLAIAAKSRSARSDRSSVSWKICQLRPNSSTSSTARTVAVPRVSARIPTSPKNCPFAERRELDLLALGAPAADRDLAAGDDVEAVGDLALGDDRVAGRERHPLASVPEGRELRPDEVGEHLPEPVVLARERRVARAPVGRAQRTGPEGTQHPQDLVDAAADVVLGDAHVHQHAVGVDDEGAAVRRPVVEQHAEGAAQLAEAVGDHRVADVGEPRVGLEPGLVAEAAVRARREQHGLLAEELGVALREGRQLGRADEREVAGIEEQDDPAAAVTGEIEHDRRGLPAEVRLQVVIGNRLADSERHSQPL